jgi:hypothetical protein
MTTRFVSRLRWALVVTVAVVVAAPIVPAAAAPGRNLVLNGSFELQRSNGVRPRHWKVKGAANDFTGPAHSGTYHLDEVVGDPLPNTAWVSQDVTIPADTVQATLTFWTEDFSCGTNTFFEAHVISGGRDRIVKALPSAACGPGYVRSFLSLERFKGSTVTLRFSTTCKPKGENGTCGLFYLDDVALKVS